MLRPQLTDLIAAAGDLLRRDDLPFALAWPAAGPLRASPACGLPVLRWLPAACAAGTPAELMAALLAAAPHLAWGQTYAAADIDAAFLDRYGWTELIGLRGPVPSRHLAAGFLLLGPDTHYPRHSHAAEELYLPLSGTAAWQRGDAPWQERAAGDCVHHPGGMPHAMRTGAAPLLAFYVWRGGDLAEKSRFDPAGTAAPANGR